MYRRSKALKKDYTQLKTATIQEIQQFSTWITQQMDTITLQNMGTLHPLQANLYFAEAQSPILQFAKQQQQQDLLFHPTSNSLQLNTSLELQSSKMVQKLFVFARVRPMEHFSKPSLQIVDTHTVEVSNTAATNLFSSERVKVRHVLDRIYSPLDQEDDLFEDIAHTIPDMLSSNKKNLLLLAYGESASGKSYVGKNMNTIYNICSHLLHSGTDTTGLIVKYASELFKKANKRSQTHKYRIQLSALEIKGEFFRDVLDKKTKPSQAYTKTMPQCTMVTIDNISAMLSQCKAIHNAMQRNKHLNSNLHIKDYTAVSHLLITLHIEGMNMLTLENIDAHITFVDLAGSQIPNKSSKGWDSKILMKQFYALQEVLQSKTRQVETPVSYRNSNLTMALHQLALKYECTIYVYCCLVPKLENLNENMRTLKFASSIQGKG